MDLKTIINSNEKRFNVPISIDDHAPSNAGKRILTTPPKWKKVHSTLASDFKNRRRACKMVTVGEYVLSKVIHHLGKTDQQAMVL